MITDKELLEFENLLIEKYSNVLFDVIKKNNSDIVTIRNTNIDPLFYQFKNHYRINKKGYLVTTIHLFKIIQFRYMLTTK